MQLFSVQRSLPLFYDGRLEGLVYDVHERGLGVGLLRWCCGVCAGRGNLLWRANPTESGEYHDVGDAVVVAIVVE